MKLNSRPTLGSIDIITLIKKTQQKRRLSIELYGFICPLPTSMHETFEPVQCSLFQ